MLSDVGGTGYEKNPVALLGRGQNCQDEEAECVRFTRVRGVRTEGFFRSTNKSLPNKLHSLLFTRPWSWEVCLQHNLYRVAGGLR